MHDLSIAQAAEQMGVRPQTVRQLCHSGALPHYRINTLYRIRPDDLNAVRGATE